MPNEKLQPDLTSGADVVAEGLSDFAIRQGQAMMGTAMARMTGNPDIAEAYTKSGEEMIAQMKDAWQKNLAKKFDAQYGGDMRRQQTELDTQFKQASTQVTIPPTAEDLAQEQDPDAAPRIPRKGYAVPNAVTGEIEYIDAGTPEAGAHIRDLTRDYYTAKHQLGVDYLDAAGQYKDNPYIAQSAQNYMDGITGWIASLREADESAQREQEFTMNQERMETEGLRQDALRRTGETEEAAREGQIQHAIEQNPELEGKSEQEVLTFLGKKAAADQEKAEKLAIRKEEAAITASEMTTSYYATQQAEAAVDREAAADWGAELAAELDGIVYDTKDPAQAKKARVYAKKEEKHQKYLSERQARAIAGAKLGKPLPSQRPSEVVNEVRISKVTAATAQAHYEAAKPKDDREQLRETLRLTQGTDIPAAYARQFVRAVQTGKDPATLAQADTELGKAGDKQQWNQALTALYTEAQASYPGRDLAYYTRRAMREGIEDVLVSNRGTEWYKRHLTDLNMTEEQFKATYAGALYPGLAPDPAGEPGAKLRPLIEQEGGDDYGPGMELPEVQQRITSAAQMVQDTLNMEGAAAAINMAREGGLTGFTRTKEDYQQALALLERQREGTIRLRDVINAQSELALRTRDAEEYEDLLDYKTTAITRNVDAPLRTYNVAIQMLEAKIKKAEGKEAERRKMGLDPKTSPIKGLIRNIRQDLEKAGETSEAMKEATVKTWGAILQ
jgi:hypothetical protein